MSDILQQICADTRRCVGRAKRQTPLDLLRREAMRQSSPRGFLRALRAQEETAGSAFIAEIKKASPSSGIIRADFSPGDLATAYAAAGAACLSVLTDEAYFQGNAADLRLARAACDLPVLRADFILDTWQIAETRAMGADAVLLILAALDDETATDLYNAAAEYGMDVLVEIHGREELDRALKLPSLLLGVNSRNLKTLKIDLNRAAEIIRAAPAERFVISESGLQNPSDIEKMRRAGARGFMAGEALLKEPDAGSALAKLRLPNARASSRT